MSLDSSVGRPLSVRNILEVISASFVESVDEDEDGTVGASASASAAVAGDG